MLVPLSSSAPDAAAFSRLEVGGAAADAAASLLESPPSKEFHLEGVRSREAHRLRAVEDDRCIAALALPHIQRLTCHSRAVELKISQAVRKRIDTAQLTCRELLKVFQTRRASDLAVKNSCSDLLALVTDESATLSPALTAIKNQFAAIAAIYEESSQSIETEGVNRASSMSESFTAQVHKARNEVGSHVPELQAARALAKQTYSKQEKAMTVAFNPQGTIVVNDPALALQLAGNPELDPWLATVAHEAAVKGVETLGAKQQGAFQNGVTDLLEADNRRLEATKSLLLTFLQNEKKKLQAHLDAVDSLFDCVQDINPSTDANSFLSSFNISEADLSRNKKEAKSEGGSQPPDMGVWIPDESVKVCTQVRIRPVAFLFAPVFVRCFLSAQLLSRFSSASITAGEILNEAHVFHPPHRLILADTAAVCSAPIALPTMSCYPFSSDTVIRSAFARFNLPLFFLFMFFFFVHSEVTRHQSCVPAIEAAKESFNADQVLLGESCKTEALFFFHPVICPAHAFDTFS